MVWEFISAVGRLFIPIFAAVLASCLPVQADMGGALVCIQPVPKVIRQLSDYARANPSLAVDAEKNANYLVLKYCRRPANNFFDLFSGNTNEDLGQGCFMLTGRYRSEIVYYFDCLGETEGD
jgi:hypothetical protein